MPKHESKSSLTIGEIHAKADSYTDTQRGDAKKRKEAFWNYISTTSSRMKGHIQRLQNGEIIESEEKAYIMKELEEVYHLWVDKYDMERAARREKMLEKENIPLACSRLIFPNMDPKIIKRKGTTLAALMAINSYCKKFESTNPKNPAEQAFLKVCISPLLDWTNNKIKVYSKTTLIGKKKQIEKKEIIFALCHGGPGGLAGGLAGLSTLARALAAYSTTASRTVKAFYEGSIDESKVKMCYKGLIQAYGEILDYDEFVKGEYVTLRRGAKFLSDSMSKSMNNILKIINALGESSKNIKV